MENQNKKIELYDRYVIFLLEENIQKTKNHFNFFFKYDEKELVCVPDWRKILNFLLDCRALSYTVDAYAIKNRENKIIFPK